MIHRESGLAEMMLMLQSEDDWDSANVADACAGHSNFRLWHLIAQRGGCLAAQDGAGTYEKNPGRMWGLVCKYSVGSPKKSLV